MNELLPLAFKNLKRNPRRNLTTGLAIALGFAALVLIGGYLLRVERLIRINTVYLHHVGHLAVFKQGGLENASIKPRDYHLEEDEQNIIAAHLSQHANVDFFGRILRGGGLAGNGCTTVPFISRGVEPEVERRLRTHPLVEAHVPEFAKLTKGTWFWQADDIPNGVALSEGLAKLLGKSRVLEETTGELIMADCQSPERSIQIAQDANIQLAGGTFEGSFSAVDGEVMAHFSTGESQTNDSSLLAPLSLIQSLHDTDSVTFMPVFLKDASRIEEKAVMLSQELRSLGVPVSVYPYTYEDLNPYYVGTLNFLKSLAAIIGLVLNIVVVLSIANSMTISILERTREVGTLRSMGFKASHIRTLFTLEAGVVTLLGVGAGLILAFIVAALVNAANIQFLPPGVPTTIQFVITPSFALCLGVALLMLVLSMVTTFVVARKQARENITHLLTSTGA